MNARLCRLISVSLLGFGVPAASAATLVYIKTATLAGVILQNQAGSALDGGATVKGDGTLLEFGYYSQAATATPFAGTWTPLTGPHSESLVATTIGDGLSGADGKFSTAFQLNLSLTTLPAVGTPLVMRFYDSKSRVSSTAFNEVAKTDGTWAWNPSALQIDILVGDDPGTVWLDGPSSAFRTTIAIPEPSGLLMLLGAAGLCLRRRK